MKKRTIIILSITILMIAIILFCFLFLFKKNESTYPLILQGNNAIVESINEKYNIPYKKESSKEVKLLLKKDSKEKELTTLNEYDILSFYMENGIISKETIYEDYFKILKLDAPIFVYLENNNFKIEEIIATIQEKYSISIVLVKGDRLENTTKRLLQDYLNSSLLIRIQKDSAILFESKEEISSENLEAKLLEFSLIKEIPKEEKPEVPSIPNKPANPTAPNVPTPPIETPKPSEPEKPIVYFEKINTSTFTTLTSSSTKQIIVAGKAGCGYCSAALPVLEKIANEKKIKIYYIDLSVESNALWNGSITNVPSRIGTPYAMIIQNNTIISAISQKYLEIDYLDFLKNNGF